MTSPDPQPRPEGTSPDGIAWTSATVKGAESYAPPQPVRSKAWQKAWQVVAVLAAWALFVVFWIMVASTTALSSIFVGAAVIVIAVGVFLVLTLLWVSHNLRIFRRRGPRTGVRHVEGDFSHDFVKRPVLADWGDLRSAALIAVTIDDGKKTIRPVSALPGRVAGEER